MKPFDIEASGKDELIDRVKETILSEVDSENEWASITRRIYSPSAYKLIYPEIKPEDVDIPISSQENVSIMRGSLVSDDSEIGEYTYIGFNCMVTKTKIGRYASIANNVTIGPGEHSLDSISTNSIFYQNPREQMTEKPCVIGHDVWIGDGCIIRRGVEIGTGSVIGANSFVNENVEPYTIVAGSPARVIRKRFNREIIDAILESKWWELPIDGAKEKIGQLSKMLP